MPFEAAFPESHWISRYIAYAGKQFAGPLEYHEALAISLLAGITPGVRAELNLFPEGLATNLFLLLVGPTSTGKSLSRRIGKQLLDIVLPNSVLPDRMTGEAAMHTLAARPRQSSLWLPDEFGVTMGEIATRDYMRPLEALLLSLYDEGNYKYTTVKDSVVINGAHLSIIGSTTPQALALAGAGAVLSGLLPRFGVVFPEFQPPRQDAQAPPNQDSERAALLLHLREIQRLTQTPGAQRSIRFSKAALVALNEPQSILDGMLGKNRLIVMAYKVAVLSALADLRTEVSEQDAGYATAVIGRWAAGSQRLDPYLSRRASDLEFDRLLERVRTSLRASGGTARRGAVSRALKLEPTQAKKVRDCLLEWGELKVVVNSDEEVWTLIG